MALKTLSTEDLKKELARRERNARKLVQRRDKLQSEIASIDRELSALGEPVAGSSRRGGATGRRRARNDISLPDAIAKAMEIGAVVSPAEAAKLVRANGYRTTSKTFNMMVSNALSKDKRFKRLGRGQYERTR